MNPPVRRAVAEFVGTGLLVLAVVGSGIMATRLSPGDVGLRLLENSVATALVLPVLILVFGPVSGAHLNPVVSLADWWLGRRDRSGLTVRALAVYAGAQTGGAIAGAVLANAVFGLPAAEVATTVRSAPHLWLGEVVATAGLVLVVFALARSGRAGGTPAAVGAYIGAAYWFTSSTSFANPAVTVGRSFTDTFAGIAPTSVPAFVGAQLLGLAAGVILVRVLFPRGIREDDGRGADGTGGGRDGMGAGHGRRRAAGGTAASGDRRLAVLGSGAAAPRRTAPGHPVRRARVRAVAAADGTVHVGR